MGAIMAVGLALIGLGTLFFAIGAAGTLSLIQIGIGIFLGVVGALVLIAAAKSGG